MPKNKRHLDLSATFARSNQDGVFIVPLMPNNKLSAERKPENGQGEF